MAEIHRGNVQGFPRKAIACKVGAAIREDAPGGPGLSIVLRKLRAVFNSDSRMTLGPRNDSQTAE